MSERTTVDGRVPAVRVPATLTALATIGDFVLDLARQAGLGTGPAYRLRLAVDELATNIVVHGYRGAPGEITAKGAVDADRVWVSLEDRAPPFDPRSRRHAPAADLPPLARPPGGLGIRLALAGLDEFSYAHTDGRNLVTLTIRR